MGAKKKKQGGGGWIINITNLQRSCVKKSGGVKKATVKPKNKVKTVK